MTVGKVRNRRLALRWWIVGRDSIPAYCRSGRGGRGSLGSGRWGRRWARRRLGGLLGGRRFACRRELLGGRWLGRGRSGGGRLGWPSESGWHHGRLGGRLGAWARAGLRGQLGPLACAPMAQAVLVLLEGAPHQAHQGHHEHKDQRCPHGACDDQIAGTTRHRPPPLGAVTRGTCSKKRAPPPGGHGRLPRERRCASRLRCRDSLTLSTIAAIMSLHR